MQTDDFYCFWLCNIPRIGNGKIKALLECFGTAQEVYRAGEEELGRLAILSKGDIAAIIDSKKDILIAETYRTLTDKGINFVHIKHKDYPKRLLNVCNAPIGLYYKGRLPAEDKPTVAVVGARNCSVYGKKIAYDFCKRFADMGWQVISGLALGIDTAAHKGCVDNGGYTCAVLGCGADICYPRSNIELYANIAKTGCILSEYAIGTPPLAGQFPIRNRIISGLADAVVIVEARGKSGSLITVDHALEQGKEVFAVPGRIGDSLSEGCNWLLKTGASVITEPEDILSINFKGGGTPHDYCSNEDMKAHFGHNSITNLLATEKNIVYSGLDLYPKSLDIIIEETGLDIAVVSEQLLCLQLEGLIQEVSKNCYCRV